MSPIEALPEADGESAFKEEPPLVREVSSSPIASSNPHPLSSCLTSDSAWLPTTYIQSSLQQDIKNLCDAVLPFEPYHHTIQQSSKATFSMHPLPIICRY